MDAADAARCEDADPGRAPDGERAADRRRADRALDGCGREVTRADFAGERPEASELLLGQPDVHLPAEDSDRRRHGAGLAHLPLGLEANLDAFAGWEAVRHERRLERDDGASRGELLAHLVGDADHAERSISTKRLSSAWRTSRKPALRYARKARSFQRATQRRKVRGRHSRRA